MNTKISIVTFYTPNLEEYAKLTDISKEAYCKKHNYKYFKHNERTLEDRHPYWEKPNALLAHFDDSEYVVWTDADVIIANLDFDIATLFDDKDKVIYMSKDRNGWNNGVFCVKTNDIGKEFLLDTNNNYSNFKNHRWPEQQCMGYLMDNKYKEYVKELPYKVWNSYGCNRINPYTPGDFIMHAPGRSAATRVKLFKEINAKNNLSIS